MFKPLFLSAALVLGCFAAADTADAHGPYRVQRGYSVYSAPVVVYRAPQVYVAPVRVHPYHAGYGGFYGSPYRSFYNPGFNYSGFGYSGFGPGFGYGPGFGRGGFSIGFGF